MTEPKDSRLSRPKLFRKKLCVMLGILALVALLAACAPKQTSDAVSDNDPAAAAGNEQATAQLPAWSATSECASCHEAEVASGADPACTYALHTTVACATCHTDEGGLLATAHEDYATAKQPTRLKTTNVTEATCLASGCHDTEALKEATAAATALTDQNGTVVNPHDLPQTATHTERVDCSTCHKTHLPTPVSESAPKACLSCHHAEVYECNTCHEA